MTKETKTLILTLLMPLVIAVCGWINSHAQRVEAEKETVEMSDSFQDYIEYVMEQRGCKP